MLNSLIKFIGIFSGKTMLGRLINVFVLPFNVYLLFVLVSELITHDPSFFVLTATLFYPFMIIACIIDFVFMVNSMIVQDQIQSMFDNGSFDDLFKNFDTKRFEIKGHNITVDDLRKNFEDENKSIDIHVTDIIDNN